MNKPHQIDLTNPIFAGMQQAAELLQLRQQLNTLDNVITPLSIGRSARLKGALEQLHQVEAHMTQQLHNQVTKGAQ